MFCLSQVEEPPFNGAGLFCVPFQAMLDVHGVSTAGGTGVFGSSSSSSSRVEKALKNGGISVKRLETEGWTWKDGWSLKERMWNIWKW